MPDGGVLFPVMLIGLYDFNADDYYITSCTLSAVASIVCKVNIYVDFVDRYDISYTIIRATTDMYTYIPLLINAYFVSLYHALLTIVLCL